MWLDRCRGAEQWLARLEVAGEMMPSLDWFIYAFVRKEAVVSSQIEGTQATLVDLFEYEAETPDWRPPLAGAQVLAVLQLTYSDPRGSR